MRQTEGLNSCTQSQVLIHALSLAPLIAQIFTPDNSQNNKLVSGPAASQDGQSEGRGLVDAQQRLRALVLDTVASPHSQRNYAKALDDLFEFSAVRPLTRELLMEYRASINALAASTINVRLSAIRKLVGEARRLGLIGAEEAANLTDIPNIRQKGTRLGNWLTREQAKELLAVPDRSTLKGKRDYVILALLVGCALRRTELAELEVSTIQLRENRWVLADLEGKGRRIRTVAVPLWVKQGINAWMIAAKVEIGETPAQPPQRRQSGSEPERLGGLVGGRAIGQGDRSRALRSP